jgi:hypothetical protein
VKSAVRPRTTPQTSNQPKQLRQQTRSNEGGYQEEGDVVNRAWQRRATRRSRTKRIAAKTALSGVGFARIGNRAPSIHHVRCFELFLHSLLHLTFGGQYTISDV